MKLIGLVDTSIKDSKSHVLLEFIAKEYSDLFDLEVLDITRDLVSGGTKDLKRKISVVEGLIVISNKENQAIASELQNSLKNKVVLVISASDYDQENSASQLHFRQILEDPAVGAYTFPGNEFFLGRVLDALDEEGQIKDQEIIASLRKSLEKYCRFVELINGLEETQVEIIKTEDLYATGSVETTIEGLDKDADDWLEQAAKKVNAADGNTYVKLDRGILTVNQLNYFLNSMPIELTFMDSNNQFLYYNYNTLAEEMLASTHPTQVGSPIAKLHPEGGHGRVEMLIQQLRAGKTDSFAIHVPTHGPDKFVIHNYKAIRDKAGNYLGVNEYVLDIQPTINWYLKQSNQELVGGSVDAVSSATTNHGDDTDVDGVSSASTND